MENYVKPSVISDESKEGAFPFAVAAAAGKVVASKAFAAGAAVGLAKGRTSIDPNYTAALTART